MDFKLLLTGVLLFHWATGAMVKNVARQKPTQSSSIYEINNSPSKANDGSYENRWHVDPSCFATGSDLQPWWMVDLQAIYKIRSFMVLNRLDCCPYRLQDFTVETFLENPVDVTTAVASHCYFFSGYPTPGVPENRDCDQMVVGRYFRIHMNPPGSDKVMTVCEVEVYAEVAAEVYASIACTCSRFNGMLNARISHDSSFVVNSAAECAEECTKLVMCRGFNFKLAECQIVTELSEEPLQSQGWTFFQHEQC